MTTTLDSARGDDPGGADTLSSSESPVRRIGGVVTWVMGFAAVVVGGLALGALIALLIGLFVGLIPFRC